jgi:signal transduction histidine kinase
VVVTDLTEFRKREDLLREFSRNLMQMLETERRQIAIDLGDNVAQLLCTILARCQLLANRLPPKENGFREEASEFATLLRTTADEVHRISRDLRPHGLEVLGLVSAVRGMAAEFSERMGIPIDVHSTMRTTHLPVGAKLVVYRILQEALRNVEQHAMARGVSVTLRRRGSAIQVAIKDDGIDFDPRAPEARAPEVGGFGLLSMHERARSVGGSIRLKSASAMGTEILLSVPLPASRSTGPRAEQPTPA